MRRFCLLIIATFSQLQLIGQLQPLSDQYYNNMLAINPAFAGSHDALSATVFYRNQWVGFSGAPKGQSLSLHSPFYDHGPGLGLMVRANSLGIYRETIVTGNYAWRMDLENGKLAFGLGFGASVYNVAWHKLNANDLDDILLMNNPNSFVLPDLSIGSYYYGSNFYLGFSIPMFLSHEADQISGRYRIKNDPARYNYFITGGFALDAGHRLDIIPSALIKYSYRGPVQMDLSAQAVLQDMIWIGAGYRSGNSLIGTFQCQLNHQLRLGYSYSFDLGPIGRYNTGSHEVMLNYVFMYKQDLTGPRHFGLN